MDVPPIPATRPFAGRAKWGEVAGNLALVALGVGLVGLTLAVDATGPAAMRALVGYAVFAVIATLALTIATTLTRQLPTLRRARLEGVEAQVIRSWWGEWWYAVAIDAGLVAVSATLVGLGLAAQGGWAALSLVVAAVGAYFLVRVVLTVTGRRRNDALWLTDHEVVHDAPWGRERVRREHVTRVRASTTDDHLVLEVDGPIERQVCPRPWRRGTVGAGPRRIVLDCSSTGHHAADLAAWLGAVATPR